MRRVVGPVSGRRKVLLFLLKEVLLCRSTGRGVSFFPELSPCPPPRLRVGAVRGWFQDGGTQVAGLRSRGWVEVQGLASVCAQ